MVSALALACLAVIGCGSRPAGPSEEQPADAGRGAAVDARGVDPLDLPGELTALPVEYPRAGVIETQSVLQDARRPSADTAAETSVPGAGLPEYLPTAIDSIADQAFRVQIFTSKTYGEARHAFRVAEEVFDQPAYIDYDVPYFKVRVGNFATRAAAEVYQQKVKTVGYSGAWVVWVNTGVQEVSPQYDDLPTTIDADTAAPEDSLPYED